MKKPSRRCCSHRRRRAYPSFELLPDELLDGEALLEALDRDEEEGPDSSWHAASAGIARARLSPATRGSLSAEPR